MNSLHFTVLFIYLLCRSRFSYQHISTKTRSFIFSSHWAQKLKLNGGNQWKWKFREKMSSLCAIFAYGICSTWSCRADNTWWLGIKWWHDTLHICSVPSLDCHITNHAICSVQREVSIFYCSIIMLMYVILLIADTPVTAGKVYWCLVLHLES